MHTLLTLSEFAAVAANAVQASEAVPENRQAKAVPAERMVRYYTARGLLPRPGTRGRALTYGRTHLLHLVAIKRLQGQGFSLDEIAERLHGMSSAELESLAAIPAGAIPPDLGDIEADNEIDAVAGPSRSAGRFWQTVPEMNMAAKPAAPEVNQLQAVRLSDTVTLLVDGLQDPLPSLDALRRAAAPLLGLLSNTQANTQAKARKDDHQ